MENKNNITYENIFFLIQNHIISVLTFTPIDLTYVKINLIHFVLVLLIYSLLFYLSYLISMLFKFKLVKIAMNIMLPTYSLYSCITIVILSFIGGKIYSIFLNDYSIKNYYLVLLACGYLPVITLLSIAFTEFLSIFYLCAGIASDYFLRSSLSYNREWERNRDKIYFITISMLMNIGTYWILFPLIYMD